MEPHQVICNDVTLVASSLERNSDVKSVAEFHEPPVAHGATLLVMGAGSLGLLFGGLVATAPGVRVTVVGRRQHVEAIRAAGLRIVGPDGSIQHVSDSALNAATDPATLTDQFDFVLIATKRYDLELTLQQLRAIRERVAVAFSLQNGIDHDTAIGEALGASRVLGATTMEGAETLEPGVVKRLVASATYIGESDGQSSVRAMDLVGLLNRGGLRTELTTEIGTAQWTKFVQSCAASAVCGVTRRGYAAATATNAGASLYVRLVKEGSAVMEALGMSPGRFFTDAAHVAEVARLADGSAVALVKETAAGLLDRGHSGSTSLARDLQDGRRTENDALLGAMCRIAGEHGVAVPTMEAMYFAIRAAEEAAP